MIARSAGVYIVAAIGALFAAAATGHAEFIPVPDFSAHAVPVSIPPAADSNGWEVLNVVLLLGALVLASYLALVRRSRRGLTVLAVASLVWFGFVRTGCVCPIGSVQNVSLALFDPTYTIPIAVVAMFALPLVFTLFFGRTFCAAVCPLGAVQELVCLRSVAVPRWLDHGLGLLPYVYLGAAVILAAGGGPFLICRYDPFVPLFRLGGDLSMLIVAGSMLALATFVGRPYCRYLCPYGGILAWLSRVSRWHARIPPKKCIQCRLCENACPYDAIETPAPPLRASSVSMRRRWFVGTLAALPLLVAGFAAAGTLLAVPLAHFHHDVSLARRLQLEDAGKVDDTTPATDAFRSAAGSRKELHAKVDSVIDQYKWLGGLLGGWIGLVIGVKLVSLTIHRRRADYEPDRGRCVSCARCYEYCPEHVGLAVPGNGAGPDEPQERGKNNFVDSPHSHG